MTMHLKINGSLYRLRRLPHDRDMSGVVSYSLASRKATSEVCAFSEACGEASCTCGHSNAHHECKHIRAIREAAAALQGLPSPKPDWLKEAGIDFAATNDAYFDRLEAAQRAQAS